MFIDLEDIQDPFEVYREMRKDGPVQWDENLAAWVVLGHAEVSEVFTDKSYSSDRVSKFREKFSSEKLKPLFQTLSLLMLQRDEPDHTRLRKLVDFAFKHAALERYEGQIRDLAKKLFEPGVHNGGFDFVKDFAIPLPILVISDIVGIAESDRERVKAWCDGFSLVALNFYAKISDEQLHRGVECVLEFRQYLRHKIEELRRNPKNDLLSALVHAEEDGDRLSLDELVANTFLLLNAGNETTTCLLANGLLALCRNPEQLKRLRDDPSRIPVAVEELLRHDSPVQFIGRIATEDRELAGKSIKKGDLLLLVLGAAGRDPEVYQDQDSLTIDRQPNRHVSFGLGHHKCLGLQLARLEARIAFGVLLDTFASIDLEQPSIKYGQNLNMRCPQEMMLKVTTADQHPVGKLRS